MAARRPRQDPALLERQREHHGYVFRGWDEEQSAAIAHYIETGERLPTYPKPGEAPRAIKAPPAPPPARRAQRSRSEFAAALAAELAREAPGAERFSLAEILAALDALN